MVNFAQLRSLDTSKLSTAADTAQSLSKTMSDDAEEVFAASEISDGTWDGMDKEAASNLVAVMGAPLKDVSEMAKKASDTLDTLVGELKKAKSKLDDAFDLVAGTGITISGDGTVVTPTVDDAVEAIRNARLAQQASKMIEEAVEAANAADNKAIGGLAAAGEASGPVVASQLASEFKELSKATSRFGDFTKLEKAQLERFAPRGPDGKFISPKGMSRWQQALAATKDKNFAAKPGQAANVAKWTKYGKLAKLGTPLSFAAGIAEQIADDWNRDDLSTVEKSARATYSGAAQGAGGLAGAWAGAKGGAAAAAAVGTVVPGVGNVVGVAVGGILGGVGGALLGSGLGAKAADATVDAVGSAADKVADGVSSAWHAVTPW